ncbi:MAG: MOSC domain-containing protein [Saprospirales bacterium]|nr:MAG: MOSC domain-containing protein [Saprospirales bacterium]
MNSPATVEWIGIRPKKGSALIEVQKVEATTAEGLVGDHYKGQSGKRQLTFVLKKDLEYVAHLLGLGKVEPEKTRRNLLLEGLDPEQIKTGQKFRIGDQAIIEITGPCFPCKRMDQTIGSGAEQAMENRGGYTARVIRSGSIGLNDLVVAIT